MDEKTVPVYIDFKSPYAYLAVEPARTLERDYRVRLDWLPYTLDIPDFLGSARVDEHGHVIEQARSAHQWRRVRYAYLDVRRYANLRGLTVRGPRKIWDSSLAAIGLLYAKEHGVIRAYTDIVFERFWQRALDIEDPKVIEAVLAEAGAGTTGFAGFARGEGRARHDRIRAAAEEAGVFGVPTFVLDGEIFFGREHLALIRLRLAEQDLARPDVKPVSDVSYAWRPDAPGV
jgi:2-hydroxychromene-2-carboxylate isomerase